MNEFLFYYRESIIKICCINRFNSLCKNLFNLLEFLAEVFQCHVHHFQCLMVPIVTVNLLIQHIIVQDQDGQNYNIIKITQITRDIPSYQLGNSALPWLKTHLGLVPISLIFLLKSHMVYQRLQMRTEYANKGWRNVSK